MKLFLVRHGQTLFNQKHRIQGWCDSPLSEQGVTQAISLGKGLQGIPFVAAYTSTSERAQDTANYILQGRNIPLIPLKGLKEMNFGTLEGEYEKDYLAPDGSTHDEGFLAYGGETIPITKDRVGKTLKEIVQQHPNGNVLVVSHGGAIMCALLALSKEAIDKFRNGTHPLGNCSISIVNYDTSFHVETIGDNSYLNKGMKGE